jgi:tetratricopeptide (TPR) repeat protein
MQNAEGVRLYQQAYYQGAAQQFQQALAADPTNADAYYNLAATYHQTGKAQQRQADLDQAENLYNQCLDRNPNHRDCYRALAVLLVEQNRSEEAFRLMEGWSARSPALSDPKIELARLYDEFGDKAAAQQHLLAALTTEPNNARALAALGKIREESGDRVQALADYQRSLWHDRFQPEVAARVAALQTATSPTSIALPAPPGTRTVNGATPPTNLR